MSTPNDAHAQQARNHKKGTTELPTLDPVTLTPQQRAFWLAGYESGLTIGYAKGHGDGYWQAEDEMAAVWAVTAAKVRRMASQPTRDELARLRAAQPPSRVPSPAECAASWGDVWTA